jgi:hypothetical protein
MAAPAVPLHSRPQNQFNDHFFNLIISEVQKYGLQIQPDLLDREVGQRFLYTMYGAIMTVLDSAREKRESFSAEDVYDLCAKLTLLSDLQIDTIFLTKEVFEHVQAPMAFVRKMIPILVDKAEDLRGMADEELLNACLKETRLLREQAAIAPDRERILALWKRCSPDGKPMKLSRKEHNLEHSYIVFRSDNEPIISQVAHESLRNYPHRMPKCCRKALGFKEELARGGNSVVYRLPSTNWVQYKSQELTRLFEMAFYGAFANHPRLFFGIPWMQNRKFYRVAPWLQNSSLNLFRSKFVEFSAQKQIHALLQLAKALQTVHAAGWLHGDLCGANVFVLDDGSLVLADFESAVPDGTDQNDSLFPRSKRKDVYDFGYILEISSVDMRSLIASMQGASPLTMDQVVVELEKILAKLGGS